MLESGTRVHFVGIGGVGMSGLAELLVNLGYTVSGSDLALSAVTSRLAKLGVRVWQGHDASHVGSADLIVVSTAVPPDNPERLSAEQRGVPVVPRGELLAQVAAQKRSVAVAGSHGKTTVSAMLAVALEEAGLDPTAVIGGRVQALGSNTRLGGGPFIIIETDESDRSFLRLRPEIAVLTNIDDEHLEAYTGMADLEQAFIEFTRRVHDTGCVVACLDDPRLRTLVPALRGPVMTYSIDDSNATIHARNVTLGASGSRCQVRCPGADIELRLTVPGRHNVLNALAALAVGIHLGVPIKAMTAGLTRFEGADRRFHVRAEIGGITVVDDYGHHPTEIAAVLRTARLRAPSRLRVVFQPHRYSRTQRLLSQFGEVLAGADELFLSEIYPASEPPRPGVTSAAVADAVRRVSSIPVHEVMAVGEIPPLVVDDAQSGDLILTLGAGSIGGIVPEIIGRLRARFDRPVDNGNEAAPSRGAAE